MQTQFSMVRQLNNEPFLVQGFVAAKIGVDAVEKDVTDWIATDRSPNLFWALTNSPIPMCDLHAIEDIERAHYEFTAKPFLSQAMDGTLAEAEWPQLIRTLVSFHRIESDKSKPELQAALDRDTAKLVDEDLRNARKYLVGTGLTETQASQVPPMKAVGLFWVSQYKIACDEQWKGWTLSYPQAAREIRLNSKMLAQWKSASHSPLNAGLFDMMRGRFIISDLDRRIALMRIIEALRDYTARHDGKPPTALDLITDLPIPLDPITGEAFVYHLENGAAIIEAPAPEEVSPAKSLRYELTFESH